MVVVVALAVVGGAVYDLATTPQALNPRISNNYNGPGCTDSLASCHKQGKLAEFQENEQISDAEFDELLTTVAAEFKVGSNPPISDPDNIFTYSHAWMAGRGSYDTPFYNGGGAGGDSNPPYDSGQQVCIGDTGCWGRSEVNYFAQGMWSADAGETLDQALRETRYWNKSHYSDITDEVLKGKLYWTEYGYEWYKNWQQWGDAWQEHWTWNGADGK